MVTDAERTIRLWRAAEMFGPRPLPRPDARDNVTDAAAGEPLPWEPGGKLAGRPAAPGKAWRHQVFGGLFALGKVRGTLTGESALFTCTLSAAGALADGPAVSECAWAVGQTALGDDAAGSGDPSSWLTGVSGAGRLPVARENLPDLPDGPLTAAALTRFAAELAGLLGVTDLLEPSGLRVRSYQASADTEAGAEAEAEASPLAGYFAADLARVAGAVRASAAGLPLLMFLGDTALGGHGDIARVDVRRHPLTVRDGCSPDRMPSARWPADAPPVLSEQFAVNEILGRHAPLSAVEARPDGTAAVFNELVAAIVTERAKAMAALPSAAAAFGPPLTWGPHSVAPPAPALTGFEILLAAPSDALSDAPGLGTAGAAWRDRAASAGYFAATARLAAGEPWAMIRAHLGDVASRRAFADRFWHGRVHGSEALFSVGEPIRAGLREIPRGGWRGAVAGFRSALADVDFLSSERMTAADTLARFSALEQACEDAYSALEEAQVRVAALDAREPDARAAVIAAEEWRRAALADLEVHQVDRPGLAVSMSTGLRAAREWHAAHARLRAAFDAAARARDQALDSVQALRADLAAARKAVAGSQEAASRLAASMDALQGSVTAARKRWGDHVPEGPSYAETEDAALIERREHSAPWSDREFATARAGLFLSALSLHKALLCANAPVIEQNLAAWIDMVAGDHVAGPPPPGVALAAWQSFFLVVPVVSTTFSACGALLAGLGRGSVGWLLAAGAGGALPRQLAGALWRANRAVLAGTSPGAGEEEDSALSLAARVTRFGTRLPDGAWTGLPLYSRPGAASPAAPSPAGDSEMLRAVLLDLRRRARSRRPSRTALARTALARTAVIRTAVVRTAVARTAVVRTAVVQIRISAPRARP